MTDTPHTPQVGDRYLIEATVVADEMHPYPYRDEHRRRHLLHDGPSTRR